MKLAFIGTGKIVSDALGAVEPVENLERTAILARPRSKAKAKAQAFADQYQSQRFTPITPSCLKNRPPIRFTSA